MASSFITIDSKEIEKAIKDTKLKLPNILVRLQKKVNQQVIKSAKARFKSQFNVNNHNNYTLSNASAQNNANKDAKPILKNFKNTKSRKYEATTWILNNSYYANWLEKGVTINAKNQKYLTFKINGEWKKVKSVTIPPRPFLEPAGDEYWKTSKNIPIQEKELQRILQKYWEK